MTAGDWRTGLRGHFRRTLPNSPASGGAFAAHRGGAPTKGIELRRRPCYRFLPVQGGRVGDGPSRRALSTLTGPVERTASPLAGLPREAAWMEGGVTPAQRSPFNVVDEVVEEYLDL